MLSVISELFQLLIEKKFELISELGDWVKAMRYQQVRITAFSVKKIDEFASFFTCSYHRAAEVTALCCTERLENYVSWLA